MSGEQRQSVPELGVCPRCSRPIARINEIIEYERADGSRSKYARCTDCDDVVRPK